jgi:hypothetical protein
MKEKKMNSLYVTEAIENYKSKNTDAEACTNDWCISPMPGSSVKQVKVRLNDEKAYDYACRYNIGESAIAVVGYQLASNTSIDPSQNTGKIGQVEDVLEKLAIRRDYAVEVDFVFNSNPVKKDLTQCIKYLSLGAESYNKTLQFGKECAPIRPIIYYIRKILTASSILSHPKMVKAEDIELAKNTIFSNMTIDENMVNLYWGPPEDVGVVLADFHAPDESVKEIFGKITDAIGKGNDWYENSGKLGNMSRVLRRFASLDIVNDFIKKYAHFGAVSLIIRGGFMNLLKAYLSVNPPISEFYDEMCQVLDGVGHNEAFEVLKAYGN